MGCQVNLLFLCRYDPSRVPSLPAVQQARLQVPSQRPTRNWPTPGDLRQGVGKTGAFSRCTSAAFGTSEASSDHEEDTWASLLVDSHRARRLSEEFLRRDNNSRRPNRQVGQALARDVDLTFPKAAGCCHGE